MRSQASYRAEPMRALVWYSCADDYVGSALPQEKTMRYVQCCERGSRARVPELDEIVLAARHQESHRRVPLDAFDVPSMASQDPFLPTFCKRPDAYGRVVAGRCEAFIVGRETESTYGLSVCGPRGEIIHVGLEILDDAGLIGGRDVGAGVVEGQRAYGGVVRLEDGFKVEREPVPGRELPARGTRQYAATFWRPLRATLDFRTTTQKQK
jgi:hypothetical protein